MCRRVLQDACQITIWKHSCFAVFSLTNGSQVFEFSYCRTIIQTGHTAGDRHTRTKAREPIGREIALPRLGKRRTATNDLNHIRFPKGISQRAAIALVNLAALVIFVAVELGFSYFNFPTPRAMVLAAVVAFLFRSGELALSRSEHLLAANCIRTRAVISICAGIVIPFSLAAGTRQFHSHYFGLLILPVLEAALYFSLVATLFTATVASCTAFLWVAYAAHFHPPFQLGELLEVATLILLHFTVGSLVWVLFNLLGKREGQLRDRLCELELTRSKLVEEEKLAAIGRLASAVAHEIRNPVAIISSAIEAAASTNLSLEEREDMSKVALTEARRLEKLTTDFLSYAQPGDLPHTEVDVFTLVGYIASIAKAQALGSMSASGSTSRTAACFMETRINSSRRCST